MDEASPWSRHYIVGTFANWMGFLAVVWLMSWGSAPGRVPVAALWAIGLLLTGSVAAQFIVAYRLVARQDEFLRAVTAKRVIAAAGLTITAAVFWGLAQQFLGAPLLPMWLVYPLFWGLVGVSSPFITDSRP